MNVMELINSMMKRPQMFIYPVKIDYIFYFIFGFFMRDDLDFYDIDNAFKNCFSNWIVDWIDQNVGSRYESENTLWYQSIMSAVKDDQEAVDLFFKASKEFFQDCINNHLTWQL